MRYSIVSLIAVLSFAAPAAADGPLKPDVSGAHVVRPETRQKPVVVRRTVSRHQYSSPLYAFYPPTVIRDGRTYFYYPQSPHRRSTGVVDRLAEPLEEPRHRYRYHRFFR